MFKKLNFILYFLILINACKDNSTNPNNSVEPKIININPTSGKSNDKFFITCVLPDNSIIPSAYIGTQSTQDSCFFVSVNKNFAKDTVIYEFKLPSNARSGKVILDFKEFIIKSENDFIIINSKPEIISINPLFGYQNDTIRIIGKNLGTEFNKPSFYFGPIEKGIPIEIVNYQYDAINKISNALCRVPKNVTGSSYIFAKIDTTIVNSSSLFEIKAVLKAKITSYFPKSMCGDQLFYVYGLNFLGHKDSISVKFENSWNQTFSLNILAISDTMITCSLPLNLNKNDYSLKIKVGESTFTTEYNTEFSGKVIFNTPKFNKIEPIVAAKGTKLKIFADNLGGYSKPKILFGLKEAEVITYVPSRIAWIKEPYKQDEFVKIEGFIECLVPDGADLPIVIKSECGEIDISKEITLLNYPIKSIKLKLENLNWKYSYISEWNPSYDSSGKWNLTIPECSTIIKFDKIDRTIIFTEKYYNSTSNNVSSSSQNYSCYYNFKLLETTEGNIIFSNTNSNSSGKTGNSNSSEFSCDITNMHKSFENDSEIVYKLVGSEINLYMTNIKYKIGESHGTLPYYVGSSTNFTELLPSDNNSSVILTIRKK